MCVVQEACVPLCPIGPLYIPHVPVCIWRCQSERLRLLPIQGLSATSAWLTAAAICFNQNPSISSQGKLRISWLESKSNAPSGSKVAIILTTNLHCRISPPFKSGYSEQNGRKREIQSCLVASQGRSCHNITNITCCQ